MIHADVSATLTENDLVRVVGLARNIAAGGALDAAQFEKIIALACLDADQVALVLTRLLQSGVEVLPVDLASGPMVGSQSDPGGRGLALGSGTTRFDVDDAVHAARQLLRADRNLHNRGRKILTAAEEAGLAVILRAGRPLTEDIPGPYVRELDRRGEPYAAFEALVAHNVGLVHQIANQYSGTGLEHEDLFQHGVVGLIRSVRRFDVTLGNKLSTYATWWIRQQITRAIANEGTLIRIPVHMHENVLKVNQAERVCRAQGLDCSPLDLSLMTGLSEATVYLCQRISLVPLSFNAPIGDEVMLLDVIETDFESTLPSPESVVEAVVGQEWVVDQLAVLSDRETAILVYRLGLQGNEPLTLDAIGAIFGVTRERIRQIEVKALDKLRDLNGVPKVKKRGGQE